MRDRPQSWPWIALLGLVTPCWPQTQPPSLILPPTPEIMAVYVNQPPRIDGVLDDPCWQQAFRASGFYYIEGRRPATYDTTFYLCVDQRALYVGFYAHDAHPDRIRAFQSKRGGSMRSDDRVGIVLDARNQGKDFYRFEINPMGTQSEEFPDVGGSNLAWRGRWSAAARIVEDGWIAEAAIPFAILRYPAGQTTFGLALSRNLERLNERSTWPPMPEQFDPRLVARLTGLRLTAPKRRPLILPYSLLRWEPGSLQTLLGVDAKHTLASGLTAAITLNPDFENVEDVVETIAFTEVERFLPETRPFFAEGSSYLPDSSLLFTRRLGETDWGIKAFGNLQQQRLSALAIRETNGCQNWAFNYGFDHNPDAGFGVSLVERDEEDRSNLLWSVRGRRLKRVGRGQWEVSGRFTQSRLTNSDEGLNYAVNLDRGWGEGRWSVGMSYDLVEPEYQALAGFVPENDRRGFSFRASTFNRVDRKLQFYFGGLNLSQYHQRNGSLLQRGVAGRASFRLSNGMGYRSSFLWQHRPPNHDLAFGGEISWGQNTLYRRGQWSADYGSRGGAHYLFTSIEQGWAPLPSLQFSVSWEYARRNFFEAGLSTQRTTQTVLSANYDFSPENSLGLRFVERNGRTNLFVAYRIAPANGRNLILLFGDPNSQTTRSRWQVKMVWPF